MRYAVTSMALIRAIRFPNAIKWILGDALGKMPPPV
jgi:hypothetical protein